MLSFQPTLEEDHHHLQFMHTSFIYIATETDNHSSDDTLHLLELLEHAGHSKQAIWG